MASVVVMLDTVDESRSAKVVFLARTLGAEADGAAMVVTGCKQF